MKKRSILYINDNYIYYYQNKKIYSKRFPENTLNKGKIININYFYNKFNDFLNSNNLLSHLFTIKLNIIINPTYSKAEKTILINILEKNNIKVNNIINEINYFDLQNNNYLNINEDYLILYFKNKKNKNDYLFINKCLIDLIIKFLESMPKKQLILYGNNKDIDYYQNILEKALSVKVYIIKNYEENLFNNISNLNN